MVERAFSSVQRRSREWVNRPLTICICIAGDDFTAAVATQLTAALGMFGINLHRNGRCSRWSRLAVGSGITADARARRTRKRPCEPTRSLFVSNSGHAGGRRTAYQQPLVRRSAFILLRRLQCASLLACHLERAMNVGLASVVHFAPRLALRSADSLRGGDNGYIFFFLFSCLIYRRF